MNVKGVNQPRYTPYHIPHRTEVAGFMSILHGDDRFYNNIFIQNWPAKEAKDNQVVGTEVFDEYPTYEEWIKWFEMDKPADMGKLEQYHFSHLPVWVKGNAYFNGARSCKNEENRLVDGENEVFVRLVESKDGYRLETNVYDFLNGFKDGIINSDILGCAFEPEERYENPDGTAIMFDRDYLGEHRGVSTIPGPFASREASEKQIW